MDYFIVIEPQEFEKYKKVIDNNKILVLPFSNLGRGSIPARNWIWNHSINVIGAKKHWILDDNIRGFYRLNRNKKNLVISSDIFSIAENFVDRYKNIAMAGFNYQFFCAARLKYPAYYLNTRVYSCILLDNSIPFRWRGTYNEDTDLSLQILKAGYCTLLFNAFLCNKQTTLKMKGGNTDSLYRGDGRLKMAQSLQKQHPYSARIVIKFNRYQHSVNYSFLRGNKLLLKKIGGYKKINKKINEHGLFLTKKELKNEN